MSLSIKQCIVYRMSYMYLVMKFIDVHVNIVNIITLINGSVDHL